MIVVTVGTQFFDELVEEVDRLVARGVITDPVWAQVGLTQRPPRHIEHVAFDRNLTTRAQQASLLITHAGTGSLCEFIRLGRPMIAVVNATKADNHQLEFMKELSRVYDFCWIESPKDLEQALPHARPAKPLGPSTVRQLARDFPPPLLSG